MPELITIPISTFELSIAYVRPVIVFWLDRATIIQKMFDAFQTWHQKLDNLEGIYYRKAV